MMFLDREIRLVTDGDKMVRFAPNQFRALEIICSRGGVTPIEAIMESLYSELPPLTAPRYAVLNTLSQVRDKFRGAKIQVPFRTIPRQGYILTREVTFRSRDRSVIIPGEYIDHLRAIIADTAVVVPSPLRALING